MENWSEAKILDYINANDKIKDKLLFEYLNSNSDKNDKYEYYLAITYKYGIGTNKNHVKYVELIENAASRNIAEAQLELGNIYATGIYKEKDYTKALEYYEIALKNGSAVAAYNASEHYAFGYNVTEVDLDKSLKYIIYSAEKGYIGAQHQIYSRYRSKIYGSLLDESTAFKYLEMAARNNHRDSIWNMADAYFRGIHYPKDYSKAIEWYEKAAELGDVDAISNLINMYGSGKQLKKNIEKARYWLEKHPEPWKFKHIHGLY